MGIQHHELNLNNPMPSSEEKKCEVCHDTKIDPQWTLHPGNISVPCTVCSPSPSAGGEGWEKEFDQWASGVKQTFKQWDKNAECHICSLCGMNVEKLREVIRSLLERRDAEWKEKIKGLREFVRLHSKEEYLRRWGNLDPVGRWDADKKLGYSECLDDVMRCYDEWVKRNV